MYAVPPCALLDCHCTTLPLYCTARHPIQDFLPWHAGPKAATTQLVARLEIVVFKLVAHFDRETPILREGFLSNVSDK